MFSEHEEKVVFSPSMQEFIKEWKSKPGNLIMVLHKTQQEYGFIPRKVALALSKELDIPLAKIYGVITFYHLFKLKQPGKYNFQVCMGTACYLKGGEDIIQNLEQILGVGINTVTPDGLFSIEAVRCVGCCGLAPVMVVAGEVFGKVKKAQLQEIIERFRAKK